MPKRKPYKDVAERVLTAVRELNAALVEAHKHPHVRVHMRYPELAVAPMQYGCEVTRVTKHLIPAADDPKTFAWTARILEGARNGVEVPGKKVKKAKKAKKSKAARKAA